MENLSEFHPAIQYAVRKLSDPHLTFEKIGSDRGISKQAVEKQTKKGLRFLKNYEPGWETKQTVREAEVTPCKECRPKDELIGHLRRRLVLASVNAQLLKFFKAQVHKFFPRFKTSRLPAREKKQILDGLSKYTQSGGLIKDFAIEVGKSAKTLSDWQKAYDKHGLAGLNDKKTRPKYFGNKLPHWIKEQLVALFLRFPRWTPYQYHSYIRYNPTTQWYVCLPVIQKLKNIHQQQSQEEKDRLAKRWCFGTGTDAWTVDFTCILKTGQFKLQCLTVSDHRSRFLLHSALYLNTSTETIIKDLEELFIKYGKPLVSVQK